VPTAVFGSWRCYWRARRRLQPCSRNRTRSLSGPNSLRLCSGGRHWKGARLRRERWCRRSSLHDTPPAPPASLPSMPTRGDREKRRATGWCGVTPVVQRMSESEFCIIVRSFRSVWVNLGDRKPFRLLPLFPGRIRQRDCRVWTTDVKKDNNIGLPVARVAGVCPGEAEKVKISR